MLFETHGVDSYFVDFDASPSSDSGDGDEVVSLQLSQRLRSDTFVELCQFLCPQVTVPTSRSPVPDSPSHPLADLKDALALLLDSGFQGLNVDFAPVPALHPAALHALETTVVAPPGASVFHVFTDGSSGRNGATWAFVVLAEFRVGSVPLYFRVGYAGGWVDSTIGRCSDDALDAEATALAAVSEYLLSRPIVGNLHIHVHFDSQAAGFGTMGSQNVARSDSLESDRTVAARLLMNLVQQRFMNLVAGYHVHAHQSHPWNEMVDSIAGCIRQGWDPPVPFVWRSGALLAHPHRAWAWLDLHSSSDLPSLDRLLLNPPPIPRRRKGDPTLRMASADSSSAVTAHLRVVTVNVGTLNATESELSADVPGRAHALLMQCSDLKLDIIAVQESRARHSCTVQAGPFSRFISQAERGQGGVELWVNGEALSAHFGAPFAVSACCVWYSSSTILAVSLPFGADVLNCVVIYAPQSGRAANDIVAWWQSLKGVLQQCPNRGHVLLMGDCNAKIGSLTTAAIGDLMPDVEDLAGECFRSLCDTCGLFVPSTFVDWHRGSSWTYAGPRGARSRLDYFAVDSRLADHVVATCPCEDLDLLHTHRDHRPLLLTLAWSFTPADTALFKRKALYDRARARSASPSVAVELFQHVPSVPWAVDVNDHWDLVRSALQRTCKRWFPLPKRQQRQVYFQAATWQLLCDRKDVRQQLRGLQREQASARSRFALRWLHGVARRARGSLPRLSCIVGDFTLQLRLLDHEIAVNVEVLTSLAHKFRLQRKRDWHLWTHDQLDSRIQACQHVPCGELFRILQPKKAIAAKTGQARRPLVGLRDSQGRWCTNPVAVAGAWQSHFGAIEHAEPATLDSLQAVSRPHCRALTPDNLSVVPTLFQLEDAIRQLHPAKATGVDALGSELLRLDPCLAARRLYPMLLKSSVRCQHAVELVGGWLLPLFKGRGSPHDVSNFRAILLEPCISRAFSRALRPHLRQAFDNVVFPMQFGGSKGATIQMMHLQVQLWQSTARRQKLSYAILFVDIRSAFYGVIKQMLAYATSSAASLRALFDKLALPESVWPAFQHNILSGGLVRDASGSELLATGVEASLQHTWFLVPDGTSMQRPLTGSRPGDPNADLLFSFVMTRMLSQIHERLLHDGLIDDPVQAGGVLSHSTTWADDIAFLTMGSASDLMRRLEATASHVVDVLSEHGFGLSCGPGKTAALVEFAGKGAVQARQQMEARYDGQLRVFSEHVGVLSVPLVNKYKHLGGFVTRGASCFTDIQVRSAVALQRVRPLRKFLHHPGLPAQHKQLLLKSCGLSVLTVHAGTWSGFNLKEFQAWQAAVTKLYAILHARDASGAVPQLSHHQLAHYAQSPMALELVFIARLRLFFQLLAADDICIRTAVIHNWEVVGANSWLSAVKTSVEWLRSQVGDRVLPVELATVHLSSSWEALQPQVRLLQRQLRVASRVHLLHLRSFVDFTEVNTALDSMVSDLGWLPPSSSPSSTPLDFTCDECGEAFSTATGLAVHQRHRHGQRSALRRFATDGACRHCGKYFHTRPRLLLHWQSPGNQCWVTIFRRYHPQSLEDSLLLDQRDCARGVATHQQRLPPPELDRSWRWSTSAELAHGLPLRSVENVGDVTEDELYHWSLLGALPPQWEAPTSSTSNAPLPRPPNVLADLQSMERARCLRAGQWTVPCDPVPRPLARNAKYVLIFFSGHRRVDDIAAWLHRLGDVQPLCVDTAVDETLGNVFQTELWVRLIRSRLVLTGHGAPPCETYSVARWVPCPELAEKAPRPLRDDVFPWGLPLRSISEVKQCMVGNLLMFRTIFLLALIHLWGGAITLEHPQGTPEGDPRWGIWRSSFVKLLTRDPQIRTTSFLQGPLGRDFAKPTVLLHGRLPWLPTLLFSAYMPGWRPSRILVGRRGDQWATHEAKAYPERLCRILAESYLRFGATVSRTGDGVDPPDMAKVTAVLGAMWDPYLMDTVCTAMRADYQPHVAVSSGAYSTG
eukprot:Skav226839  [mRNA]  locus=scaffold1741:218094:224051:+ [translate_table: standard]